MTGYGMRSKARKVLSRRGLKLLKEIEDYAGKRVDFLDGTHLDMGPASAAARQAQAAAYVTHEHAKVYFNAEPVLHGVVHELLHIQRTWCERVPVVSPRLDHPENWRTAGEIESVIEHMAIISKEAYYGLSNIFWIEKDREFWSACPWGITDQFTRRMFFLIGWLHSSESVKEPTVIEQAEVCLRAEGLWDTALAIQKDVAENLHDKPLAVAAFIYHMGMDSALWTTSINDVRMGVRLVSSLPKFPVA